MFFSFTNIFLLQFCFLKISLLYKYFYSTTILLLHTFLFYNIFNLKMFFFYRYYFSTNVLLLQIFFFSKYLFPKIFFSYIYFSSRKYIGLKNTMLFIFVIYFDKCFSSTNIFFLQISPDTFIIHYYSTNI